MTWKDRIWLAGLGAGALVALVLAIVASYPPALGAAPVPEPGGPRPTVTVTVAAPLPGPSMAGQ